MRVLKIINKQTLDLKAGLHQLNIRMPTDATFRRTLSYKRDNILHMISVISNFDSIEWIVNIRNRVIVNDIKVNKIFHRYGDFAATTDLSLDYEQRFMTITYYGFY